MMPDLSPVYHALLAVAVQVVIGLLTGNWWAGAAFGAAFYLGREHAQAEYRWIKEFGDGSRSSMPWYGGFDPRIWSGNYASIADWAVPALAVVGVAVFAGA
jgi:hypothetical protein